MFQHHNEGNPELNPKLRKLFEDEQAARERFSDQIAGRAQRTWSDGRLGGDDDGDLAFAVGSHPDKELIIIDFGKPVTSVAMPPQQSIELAQALIKHARSITTTPLKISIT